MRETSTDYRHPHRPLPVAWLNQAGRLMSRAGFRPASLDPESLVATARHRTGLTDLGEDAEGLTHRLGRLVGALESEARLHPLGRLMARENILRVLTNRLRLEKAWREHPEIARVPLAPPVFVVGLQRTGTTLLHRLLASDPASRWLASFEAVNPAPYSGGAGPLVRLGHRALCQLAASRSEGLEPEDPRALTALLAERSLRYLAPDFFAIHPVQAGSPEEDCLLFDYALWGTVPEALWRVPSFSAWLEGQDKIQAYRFLARMLRLLAWQRHPPGARARDPVRWVLKTPQHLEDLDALLEVFPEARIVQTHRDPATVLASFSSMMAHSRGLFSDSVDPVEVATHWTAKARRMVTRSMEQRNAMGPWQEGRRFMDVSYAELVRAPLGQVRRIYAWMGRTLGPDARAAMEAWLGRNPQHRYGRHRYRAEDFNLDPARIRADFDAYCKRYSIPCAHPAA